MEISEVSIRAFFFEKELSVRQIFKTWDFSVTMVNKILMFLIKEVRIWCLK